jgi:hypothetical protein
LILWSLSSSEVVQNLLKESYKQVRHEDDKNQPLSIQPWGRDGYKRRYWLIEGQDDTHFRLYRENSGVTTKTNQWFSVAGSIEEVSGVASKLDEEGTPHARTLRDRIRAAIPRFEAGDEVRHLASILRQRLLGYRNGADVIIAWPGKQPSHDHSLDFLSTKVAPEARGCDTLSPMTKKTRTISQ